MSRSCVPLCPRTQAPGAERVAQDTFRNVPVIQECWRARSFGARVAGGGMVRRTPTSLCSGKAPFSTVVCGLGAAAAGSGHSGRASVALAPQLLSLHAPPQ